MKNIKSPSIESKTIFEVKELLSIVSDPSKAKVVLSEIEQSLLEINKEKDGYYAISSDFEKKAQQLDSKEKELESISIDILAKSKDISDALISIKSREEALKQKERSIESSRIDIELSKDALFKDIADKQAIISEKQKSLHLMEVNLSTLKKELEDKLGKIKSIADS